MSLSARRSAKNAASSTASRRGELTITKLLDGSASRASTLVARFRNPSSIPSNARKNATTSSMTSVPTTFDTVRRNRCTAALATRR